MALSRFLVRSVAITAPATAVDRYGNEIDDWAGATVTLTSGWVSQRSTTELVDGERQAQTSDTILFLAANTVIGPRDRVVLDGIDTFAVAGVPHRAWTPTGEHHVEVALRRVDETMDRRS